MEENRKNDQKIQELSPETMEQVSGGSGIPTKTKFCSNCKETTTWISLRGIWTCSKCARYISGNPVVL